MLLYSNQEVSFSLIKLLLRVTKFSLKKCINKLHMEYEEILGKNTILWLHICKDNCEVKQR